MKAIKNYPTLLIAVFLAALCVLAGAAPAWAIGPMTAGVEILVFDNDQVSLPNTDDSPALAAEGMVTCTHADSSCQGSIEVIVLYPPEVWAQVEEIDFFLERIEAYQPGSPRQMVLTGTGAVVNGRERISFVFRAIVVETGNGRVSVTVEATHPLASFEASLPAEAWFSSP